MAGKVKRGRSAAARPDAPSPKPRTKVKRRSEALVAARELSKSMENLAPLPEEPDGSKEQAVGRPGAANDGDEGNDETGANAHGAAEDEADGTHVDFANLVGIGDSSEDSDDDEPLETLALARLPGQVVSEVRNDEPALEKKLGDIAVFACGEGKRELPFWESLTVTMPLEKKLPDSLAMDDLKREQRFAELATAATHAGLDILRKEKVKFRRPADYFAQMVKTDTQMGKVKARILHQKEKIESAEKRRNNREIAKNKKKVRSTQLQKEQEKKRKAKEEIEAFSRLRKQRLKDRAEAADQDMHDDDESFPIELLEVEQLDEDNKFRPQSEITSGRRKAWSQHGDKLAKGSADPGSNRRSEKGSRGGRSGKAETRNRRGAGQDKEKRIPGAAGGIRKAKGSKKRLGRSRRKAGAK